MKSFLSFIVVCVSFYLSTFPIQAQREVFNGELYLGAGAGATFSKVDFVPKVSTAFKQGIYGGIAAKYISERHLGLLMELNLVQRGWEEDFDTSSGFSYNRTLNYIEIPFLMHVYFGEKTKFIFNAGPKISFLVGDNEVMSQSLSDYMDQQRADYPDMKIGMQYQGMSDPKKMEYGLVAGLGMAFKTGIGDFNLEGRYYFGLGDIFPARSQQNEDDTAYFSRSAFRMIEVKLTYYVRIF
ncbi:porin family protein [Proteiniphilum sp. UBA5384]|uniref:porin family protein n=1 Tax=Proteiniphilum sp. UBA5384 TaxID=1947279 RepID=UPI0025D25699|nr:porin family protein [Proteiniphilum sp. UBA5384]